MDPIVSNAEVNQSHGKSLGVVDEATGLLSCCMKTLDLHAAHNPMMVCSGCQQTIKWFAADKDLKNYRIFCQSRGRDIKVGNYRGRHVVVFFAYVS